MNKWLVYLSSSYNLGDILTKVESHSYLIGEEGVSRIASDALSLKKIKTVMMIFE